MSTLFSFIVIPDIRFIEVEVLREDSRFWIL